jgi:urea transporter
VWIVVVTAGSAIAMAALFSVRGVPPFTLACNFSVLLFLITGLHVARGHLGSLIKPAPPSVDGPAVETALRRTVDTAGSTDPGSVLNAVFRGLGQLFFVNSILGGVLVLVGIAICSRIAALFALLGSVIGMLVGIVLGADGTSISNGLWSFSSYDACLAIAGVFFVLTWRSALLGAACAAHTALLFGAISSFLGPWGLPAMTLPFCFGVLTFVLLKRTAPHFAEITPADIETPEAHLRRAPVTREP